MIASRPSRTARARSDSIVFSDALTLGRHSAFSRAILKRVVRALEVYYLTGRPLTDHFADTQSPLPEYDVAAFALQIPADATAERVARRVEAQFRQGLLDEIRGLLAAGVPPTAHPFTGLVYRQSLEHLHGLRDEAATRELIVRENRKYLAPPVDLVQERT